MNIVKIKSINYVNIHKRIYRGSIEYTLTKVNDIKLDLNNVNIERISLLKGNEEFNLLIEKDCQVKLNEILIRNNLSYLNDLLENDMNDKIYITLRIIFSVDKANVNLNYYIPVESNDTHKELIVSKNIVSLFRDNGTLCGNEGEFYYVIPNSRDVQISSVGEFVSVEEKSDSICYLYKLKNFDLSSVCFSIGTYKVTQLTDTVGIYTPNRSSILDLNEFIFDYKNSLRYISSYVEIYPPFVVFTLINIPILESKNLLIFNIGVLGGPDDIEYNFKIKRLLCKGLCKQYLLTKNYNIVDSWIFIGIAGYLEDYMVRYLLGHNEFLYQYKLDKDYVLQNDVREPPLFYYKRDFHNYQSKFFILKSKLLFHLMDTELSGGFVKKIIQELEVKKIDNENLKTPFFIRLIKDSSGIDMKKFFDFYVFKPGLLKIELFVSYDTKAGVVEIKTSETPTSILNKANKEYYDSILIISVETEGSFYHKIYTNKNNEYFVHKKGEDGELLFIRGDFRRENMNAIIVIQHDYMYVEQLLENEVIGQIEAIESLKKILTEKILSTLDQVLEYPYTFYKIKILIYEIIRNFRIVNSDSNSCKFNGLMKLIHIFIKMRCLPNSTILKSTSGGIQNFLIQKGLVKNITEVEFNIKDTAEWNLSDNFYDSYDHKTKKGCINELRIVISFLFNIINYNDSTREYFDDPLYLFMVLNKFVLLNIFYHKISGKRNDIIKESSEIMNCVVEIERFRLLDMVFPSNNNLITKVCLMSFIRMALYGHISLNIDYLICLAKYPNYMKLRMTAIEGLLLFKENINLELVISDYSIVLINFLLDTLIKMIELKFNSVYKVIEYNRIFITKLRNLFYNNLTIVNKIDLLDGKLISINEYNKIVSKNISEALSEKIFNLNIDKCYGLKKLIIKDFKAMKMELYRKDFKLRLKAPKPKKSSKTISILRFNYSKLFPRKISNLVIQFRFTPSTIIYKNIDLPEILIRNARSHKTFGLIEKQIHSFNRDENYLLDFTPMPFADLTIKYSRQNLLNQEYEDSENEVKNINILDEDLPHKNKVCLCGFCNDLFNALRYVLLSTVPFSKIYVSTKTILNGSEKLLYQYSDIVKNISLIDNVIEECKVFFYRIYNNPFYYIFVPEVDLNLYKTYSDIVRFPISLNVIKSKLEGEFVIDNMIIPDQFYKSFDSFYYDIERVYLNCKLFNGKNSEIYKLAIQMEKEVQEFKQGVLNKLVTKDTKTILKEIFEESNKNDLDIEINYDSIRTWNDLDDAMNNLKKTHSRHSNNGKMLNECFISVKKMIFRYFSVYKGRLYKIFD